MNFKREPSKTSTKSDEAKKNAEVKNSIKLDELFSENWEAFVIKKNKITGDFVAKIACCAHSPV